MTRIGASILVFILVSVDVFSQTAITDTASAQRIRLEVLNHELAEKNEELAGRLELLETEMLRLASQEEMYSTALEINSNLFGGISTYFGVIAILLTIILVAVPTVNYFLVLKPNQDVIKKVQNLESNVLETMERHFAEYFESLKRRKNKEVVSMLSDRANVSLVSNHFILNDTQGLEDSDFETLATFLDQNRDIDSIDADILNSILKSSNSHIAEKYYKGVLEANDSSRLQYAIKYLVKNDLESHIKYLENILKANEKGHHLLMDVFEEIRVEYLDSWRDKRSPEKVNSGKHMVLLLFNDEGILEAIKDKTVPEVFGLGGHPININVINANPFLRDTAYYSIYLTKEDKYHKKVAES